MEPLLLPLSMAGNFKLVEISRLRHHECVREDRTKWMMGSLKGNEYFGPPIVVEKNSYVILEGHHRVNSLKRMGYRKVPAVLVDYGKIGVKSWCPVIPERFAEKFRLEPSKLGLKKAVSLLWRGGHLGAGIVYCGRKVYVSRIGSSLDIRALARKYAESYIADDKVRNVKGKAIVIPAPISKRLIVKEAMSGKKFPPKSTRHVLPKMKKIRVPLERLK